MSEVPFWTRLDEDGLYVLVCFNHELMPTKFTSSLPHVSKAETSTINTVISHHSWVQQL